MSKTCSLKSTGRLWLAEIESHCSELQFSSLEMCESILAFSISKHENNSRHLKRIS